MHVPFVLAIIPWLLQGKRGVRLEGPEEIDRRERAPGAAAGMERMPSPPRARSSFCQPLSRPDRAATAGRLALIWAATPRAARQARQTPPPPPILELGGSGTVPRGDGRHACCARAAAFAGSKDMSPHYLLEVRIDFSYFLLSIWSLPVRLSRGYYRGRGWGLEAAAAAELLILMARPYTAWRPGSWKSTCLLPRLAGRERASLRRAALGAESGRCWQYTAALWGFNRTKTTAVLLRPWRCRWLCRCGSELLLAQKWGMEGTMWWSVFGKGSGLTLLLPDLVCFKVPCLYLSTITQLVSYTSHAHITPIWLLLPPSSIGLLDFSSPLSTLVSSCPRLSTSVS